MLFLQILLICQRLIFLILKLRITSISQKKDMIDKADSINRFSENLSTATKSKISSVAKVKFD